MESYEQNVVGLDGYDSRVRRELAYTEADIPPVLQYESCARIQAYPAERGQSITHAAPGVTGAIFSPPSTVSRSQNRLLLRCEIISVLAQSRRQSWRLRTESRSPIQTTSTSRNRKRPLKGKLIDLDGATLNASVAFFMQDIPPITS
jgi:hypothetical protein